MSKISMQARFQPNCRNPPARTKYSSNRSRPQRILRVTHRPLLTCKAALKHPQKNKEKGNNLRPKRDKAERGCPQPSAARS